MKRIAGKTGSTGNEHHHKNNIRQVHFDRMGKGKVVRIAGKKYMTVVIEAGKYIIRNVDDNGNITVSPVEAPSCSVRMLSTPEGWKYDRSQRNTLHYTHYGITKIKLTKDPERNRSILIRLDYPHIMLAVILHPHVNHIVSHTNDDFWRSKVERDFGPITQYAADNTTYYEQYNNILHANIHTAYMIDELEYFNSIGEFPSDRAISSILISGRVDALDWLVNHGWKPTPDLTEYIIKNSINPIFTLEWLITSKNAQLAEIRESIYEKSAYYLLVYRKQELFLLLTITMLKTTGKPLKYVLSLPEKQITLEAFRDEATKAIHLNINISSFV